MLPMLVVFALWSLIVDSSLVDERDFVLSNGLKVPRVGFGTAGLGNKAIDSLTAAFQMGFRHIDTAQATEWYDEDSVGQVLESVKDSITRQEVFITTKIHPRNYGYNQTLSSFEESLSKLRTDYVDLLLLHTPWCWEGLCDDSPDRGTYEESWHALEDLYAQGRVKAIGVSNFECPLLEDLVKKARFGVHAVQNWMDPLRQDRDARAWCADNGVLYTSYSTLGVQWHRQPNPVLSNPVINEIAAAHGVSTVIVVLTWALAEGAAIIPRSSNPKHIEELASLLGDIEAGLPMFLSAEEVGRINALEEDDRRSSNREEL